MFLQERVIEQYLLNAHQTDAKTNASGICFPDEVRSKAVSAKQKCIIHTKTESLGSIATT